MKNTNSFAKFFFLAIVAFSLVLTGCNSLESKEDSSLPITEQSEIVALESEETFNEKTSTCAEYLDNTVDANTISVSGESKIVEVSSAVDFSKIYYSLDQLTEDATNIVVGKILSVAYFDESGVGNTIYTFSVEQSLKGTIDSETIVSVMTSGGYARLSKHIEVFGKSKWSSYTEEEIASTLLHYTMMGAEEPAVDDFCVLFLTAPIDHEEPFPDGVYCELGSFMGRLVLQGDGSYSRVIPESETTFYGDTDTKYFLEEIKNAIH